MRPFLALWSGRSSRTEYWLSLVGLVVLNVFATVALGNVVASLVCLPIWLLVGTRRLHDFGTTGWWALLPFAFGFIGGFLRGAGVPLPIDEATYQMVLGGLSLLVFVVIGVLPRRPETAPEVAT